MVRCAKECGTSMTWSISGGKNTSTVRGSRLMPWPFYFLGANALRGVDDEPKEAKPTGTHG